MKIDEQVLAVKLIKKLTNYSISTNNYCNYPEVKSVLIA